MRKKARYSRMPSIISEARCHYRSYASSSAWWLMAPMVLMGAISVTQDLPRNEDIHVVYIRIMTREDKVLGLRCCSAVFGGVIFRE